MLSDNIISGEVSQAEEPDWEPLRLLVGMKLADWFMWMFDATARMHLAAGRRDWLLEQRRTDPRDGRRP